MTIQSISSKRAHLLISAGFFLVFLLIQGMTRLAVSLTVIEFGFLVIFVGFAPAYYFRRVWGIRDFVGWLLHAGVFGLLLIPVTFLVFGWLGVNGVFVHSVGFVYLLAVLGLLALFFEDQHSLDELVSLKGIKRVDWWIVIGFAALLAALTLVKFHTTTIGWDFFTYWGLDTKFIFDHNQLRGPAFHQDVINFRYTSFFPIYHALVYDLYGAVVEQYSSWINIFINFLALMLVYWRIREQALSQKLIAAAVLLLTSFTAITIVKMMTFYADIFSAFLVLIFFLILTDETEPVPSRYGQRVFLLWMIAADFYLLKSPLLVFSLILIAVWGIHDFKFIRENWKIILRTKLVWAALLVIAVLLFLRYRYFAWVGGASSMEQNVSKLSLSIQFSSWQELWAYTSRMVVHLVRFSPYLLGIWGMSLVSIFFIRPLKKDVLILYLFSAGVFAIPIMGYILLQLSLSDDSVQRYSAIVMYLFPLVISQARLGERLGLSGRYFKLRQIVSWGLYAAAVVFVFSRILYPMPLVEKFSLAPGTSRPALLKYARYAEGVVEQTGPASKIILVDQRKEAATNMKTPAIYVRYYMLYHSVGGIYSVTSDQLPVQVQGSGADYLLLLTPDSLVANCGDLFSKEEDYLIDLSSADFNTVPNACLFSEFDFIPLGPGLQ